MADGVPNNPYSGSPVWAPGLSKQVVNSIHKAGHETGIIPTAAHFPRANPVHELHVDQELGPRRRMVDELLGNRALLDNGQTWGIYPGSIRLAARGHRARRTVLSG